MVTEGRVARQRPSSTSARFCLLLDDHAAVRTIGDRLVRPAFRPADMFPEQFEETAAVRTRDLEDPPVALRVALGDEARFLAGWRRRHDDDAVKETLGAFRRQAKSGRLRPGKVSPRPSHRLADAGCSIRARFAGEVIAMILRFAPVVKFFCSIVSRCGSVFQPMPV